ncbi:hypothetical protein [Croceimicrobium hydrocarbonivorans]|uniref:Lipoprotein n=1 Tax=Croceimicrobium hydrocarbonivorans TaxID=2761580 RepID=A0A7H0VB53_9FLAO|nr:hypothetical protein [Croceimicrobium hydrocarbonivorans]QNR22951.1 hypothetical protein H4K34_11235 [Croceimicrobium hydrocarbonivorans]QNR22994.1 hypothetical protein H4K34_11450 [Croceimicrobium hydrocarbonivorans]
MLKLKVLPIAIVFMAFLNSCSQRIADLTTVSTRDLDDRKTHVLLERYVKGTDSSIDNILFIGPWSSPDIEDAIDDAVREVPGGEYMKNVVIRERRWGFLLMSFRTFTVEGDVYGIAPSEKSN